MNAVQTEDGSHKGLCQVGCHPAVAQYKRCHRLDQGAPDLGLDARKRRCSTLLAPPESDAGGPDACQGTHPAAARPKAFEEAREKKRASTETTWPLSTFYANSQDSQEIQAVPKLFSSFQASLKFEGVENLSAVLRLPSTHFSLPLRDPCGTGVAPLQPPFQKRVWE